MRPLLDFFTSFVGLIVLLPIIAALGIVIRLCLGSPTLFGQLRSGFHVKPF